MIFCGLNPASSAAVAGHNFSSGTNRFWTVLHLAGFTDVRLQPQEASRVMLSQFAYEEFRIALAQSTAA